MSRLYLLSCLVLLAFIGGENAYLPFGPNATTALMGFLSLGFLFLNLARREDPAAKRPRLTVPAACLLLVLAWSALGYFYTVDLDLSFYATVKSLTAMVFALGLILYLNHERQVEEIFWVLVVCAAIHSLFALVGQYPPIQSALHGYLKELNLQAGSRFWEASLSTFANANYFSGYLLLNLPVGIFLFRKHRRGAPRIAAGCLLAVLLLGLAFSGSPGGQVVALLQLLAASAYALGAPKLKTRALRGALYASLVLGLLAAVLFVKGTADKAREAPPTANVHAIAWNWDNLLGRFVYWQGAWEIFKRYPVTGSGPLTFVAVYPQVMAGKEPVARPRYIQKNPPHAHSLYAQTLSDSGLIGFALLMALLAAMFKRPARLLKNPHHPRRDAVFYLSLAAAGFLVHNLIESNWLVSLFIYYFALLVVLLDFMSREENAGVSLAGPAPTAAIAGFSILAAVAAADFYIYDRLIHRQILTAQTLQDIASHAERAQSFCGRCGLPHRILARTFLEGYRQTRNRALLAEAERELRAAAKLAPYNPEPPALMKSIAR